MLDPDTELSTKKTVGDWLKLEPTLRGASPAVWAEVARDFFRDRLRSLYLDPINAIRGARARTGEGFAIVAIQCSLVEFLESCYQGKNYRRDTPPSATEYNKSGAMFISFLTKRAPFDARFDEELAKDFYDAVRNGVLHEARTKRGWRIWASSGRDLIVEPAGPILYRDDFQGGLEKFIDQYCRDLETDPNRQEAFITKFQHLSI
ncbi:MAG TPA: hypothetical protein VFD66_06805 [Verrucomicrobiae bacterium]|nr:hypothetical protein [Verrucomicrobiae bacterium]